MNPWDEIFAEAMRTGDSDGLVERFYNLCLADSEQRLLNAEANAAWATEQRIIKLLEAECDCAFYAKYEIPSKCHAHKHIALIKGEK